MALSTLLLLAAVGAERTDCVWSVEAVIHYGYPRTWPYFIPDLDRLRRHLKHCPNRAGTVVVLDVALRIVPRSDVHTCYCCERLRDYMTYVACPRPPDAIRDEEGRGIMPPQKDSNQHNTLRQRTAAFLHTIGQESEPIPVQEVRQLVHELQVYQSELESQNEALHRTQRNLEASRDRYSTLYDRTPVGDVTLTHEGLILEANLTAARMLGLTRDALIHQRLADFIVPDAQDMFSMHWQRTVSTHTPQVCELAMRRQDGTVFLARLESLAELDVAGGLLPWRTVLSDITEHQWVKETLVQQRDWLEVTLASIGDAVITVDLRSAITLLNRAAEALTGWTIQEALGHPLDAVFRIIQEETRQPVANLAPQILHEGRLVELAPQTVLLTRHGSEIPIAGSGVPIRSRSGILHGVVVVFRNITTHRQLEAQLRETQKMNALETLVSGIANDFNNVLAIILGFTELAQYEVPQESPIWQRLQYILTAGQRATDVVQQLLTFSRHYTPQRQPLRLHLLLDETLQWLRATFPSTIDVRATLPATSGAVLVNPAQLQDAIIHLANNAAYAMRTTGGVLEIHLDEVHITSANVDAPPTLQPGQYLRLRISDTGTGMPPEVMTRIFEPFFTTQDQGQGTGLGLAVVYGIITSHGGAITVASTSGQGTTCVIYLPRIVEAPPV